VCACSTAACLCSASPTCGSCRFPINLCVCFVHVNICDIVIAACVLVLLLPVCAANLLYEGPFRFPVDRVWFLCIFAHISNRDMGVCVCSTTPYLCSASTTHGSMSRPTCVFCACWLCSASTPRGFMSTRSAAHPLLNDIFPVSYTHSLFLSLFYLQCCLCMFS